MTNENLFKEISGIDTDLVLEAAPCERKHKTSKRHVNIMRYAAVCAAFAVIVAGLGMFVHFNNENATPKYYAPVAKLCFDVNPGIEVDIDGNNVVVYVNAVNSDGENVIGGVDFKGKSIEEAALLLVESMVEKGYINKETNCLLLTIESERDMQELEDKLRTEIAVSIKEVEGKIIVQKIEKSEDVSQIAEEYGITVGKAKLIKDIFEKYGEFSLEELAKMNITELSSYVDKAEEKKEFVFDYPYEIKTPEGCMDVQEAFKLATNSFSFSPSETNEFKIRRIKTYSDDYEFEIYYRIGTYEEMATYSVNGKTGTVTKVKSEGSTCPYPGFVISHPDAQEIAVDGVKDVFLTIEWLTIDEDITGVPHYIVEIRGKNCDNEDVNVVVCVDAKTGEILEIKQN